MIEGGNFAEARDTFFSWWHYRARSTDNVGESYISSKHRTIIFLVDRSEPYILCLARELHLFVFPCAQRGNLTFFQVFLVAYISTELSVDRTFWSLAREHQFFIFPYVKLGNTTFFQIVTNLQFIAGQNHQWNGYFFRAWQGMYSRAPSEESRIPPFAFNVIHKPRMP